MRTIVNLIFTYFFTLFFIPSLSSAISLDNQSKNADNLEIEAIISTQPWGDLNTSSKKNCRDFLQKKKHDPTLNACAAAEEMAQRHWENASDYWQTAINNYPNKDPLKASYYLGLTLSELKQNNIKNAQKSVLKATRILKNSISLHFWLAQTYERENKHNKALAEYETISNITPHASAWIEQYYHAVAIVKTSQQKRFPYAKTELLNFLQQNPDYYSGLTLLAFIELTQGEIKQAIKHLKRANQLIPYQAFVKRLLTQAFYMSGNFQEAIKTAKQLMLINPSDTTGNYLLGLSYYKVGNKPKGDFYMNRVSKVNPDLKQAKINLVASYLSTGRKSQAIQITNGLLATKPNTKASDSIYEYSFIKLLIKLDRYDDAIKRLDYFQDNTPFQLLKAEVLTKLGKPKESEKLLSEAQRKKPNSQAVQLALIKNYISQREFKKAERQLNSMLKRWPTSAAGYLLQGDLYVFMKETDLAKQSYSKATQVEPDSLAAWRKLVQYEINTGKIKHAKQLTIKLMSSFPNFSDGYFFRGVIAYLEKNNTLADELFNKTISLQTNHYKALNHLGLMNLKQPKKAIRYFNRSLQINPKQPVVYAQLAGTYLTTNDNDALQNIVKRWSDNFPQSSKPHEFFGKFNRKSGNYKLAADAYKKAIDIAPQRSVNYLLLGDTYKKLKKYKQTIQIYNKALEQFPDSPIFLNNLAGAYLVLKQYKNAMNSALMAEKKAPDNWQIKDTIGWIYYMEGNFQSAVKVLERAFKLSNNSILAYHLGKTYYKLGNNDEAKKYLELAKLDQVQLSKNDISDLKRILSNI